METVVPEDFDIAMNPRETIAQGSCITMNQRETKVPRDLDITMNPR